MRRLLLTLAAVLWATVATAQIRPAPQPQFYNPIFAGQWKINGSLCAASTVVQGGSPTTCTGSPTLSGILTMSNGTASAPSIHGTVATKGFFFDTDPAFVGGSFGFYSINGVQHGWIANSTQTDLTTGRGVVVVATTTTLNDNGTIVLRPQASNTAAWASVPAISFGNYDGGFDIDQTVKWAEFCYNVGNARCEFGRAQETGSINVPMWLLWGNSKIDHNVIRSSTQSIAAISTVGYNLNNPSQATAGFPSQWSPAYTWCGSAWKSNATAAAQVDCFKAENRTLTGATVTTATWALGASINGGAYADAVTVTSAGAVAAAGTIAPAGLTPAGTVGTPVVVAYGNVVAATNTGTASIATVTPTVDTTYEVGCNILVTTSTTHSFSCDVTYTDEGNTARTMVMPVVQLAGSFVTSGLITNVTGAGPYESPVMTIRVKASTAVTVRTSAGGTFTTVVYNARGTIKQVS